MKNIILLLLSLIAFSGVASGSSIYQVTSEHFSELPVFKEHYRDHLKDGRLHLIEVKDTAPLSIYKYLRKSRGLEKSYFYTSGENTSFALKSGPDFDETLQKVDLELLKKSVTKLTSYRTRLTGSKENQIALSDSAKLLASFGYKVNESCFKKDSCNLEAVKNGNTDSVILVVAHIDSVGESFAGADDNGSGVSVLIEMARIISSLKLNKTIKFLITNGEEQGLKGSSFYVQTKINSGELEKISLVINMDMVGYNSNSVVELETQPEFSDLANWFADLARRYTRLTPKITLGAWGSDHVPFLNHDIPALLTIEDWNTKTPCYHQACDTSETLNYDYMVEMTRLNLAAVLTKDSQP